MKTKTLLTALAMVLMNLSAFSQNCIQSCIASAGPDRNYCPQSCSGVTIGGSPTASPSSCASISVTYAWSPSSSLSCSTCANPVATPTVTTTYTVTVTFPAQCECDGCNCAQCQRTDQVTVTIITCTPCKIINPLKCQKVEDVCFNFTDQFTKPLFKLEPIIRQEVVYDRNLQSEVSPADKPKIIVLT